jgi:hypothetical protein
MDTRHLDLLRHVPVFAVRSLLLPHVPAETNLKGMRGTELIALVNNTPAIIPKMAEELYEEYRYGGRASFYIYLFNTIPNGAEILDVEAWNGILERIQDEESPECLFVRVLDTEPLDNGIDEIHFKYHTPFQYIETENEHPETLYELHYGFLWINQDNLYMVVMTNKESVNHILESAVNSMIGCIPASVRLPKEFINNQFAIEDISRGSWYDVLTDVSRTASADDLMEKAGDEIRHLEATSDRKAGLYRENITEDIKSKLGVYLDKGKIFLTKTVSASSLRKWMYSRLHPLILQLQHLPPEDVITMTTEALPPELDLSETGEILFREIASDIVKKRRNLDRTIRISTQPGRLYSSLKTHFIKPQLTIYCEECSSVSAGYCPSCGTGEMDAGKILKCRDCGKEVSGANSKLICIAGHVVNVAYPETKLVLRPKYAMQVEIAKLILRDAHEEFNIEEEFFWIDSFELKYRINRQKVEFLPDDIDEYRALPLIEDVADIWDRALRKVIATKEKCDTNKGSPRTEDCLQCYNQNLGRLCIPKIFRALSPTFSPTPHGGSEYGDIPIDIHLRGQRKSFIGLAKTDQTTRLSNNTERPNKKADDWVAQIIRQAIRDQTVEIFGLVNPKPLNQEFKATVRLVAKMDDKPFIIFGRDELTRMLCAILRNPVHEQLARNVL